MSSQVGRRGIMMLFIIAVCVMSLGMLPVAAQDDLTFPVLTGDYAVGRSVYRWTDENRDETYTEAEDDQRELEVWAWYPAQPAEDAQPAPYITEGMSALFAQLFAIDSTIVHSYAYADAPVSDGAETYPVLIFSHGNGSNSAFYATLLEEIVSHGYIIFGVDHTYNTLLTTMADGTVTLGNPEAQDQSPDDFEVRLADVSFVIDQLEKLNTGDDPLAGKLDLEHLGIFGHSFGGATAAEACRADDRCKAAAVLDVPLQGEVASVGLSQPIMLMDAEQLSCENFIKEVEEIIKQPAPPEFAAYCETMNADRAKADETVLAASSGGYRVIINGSRHGNFGDIGFLLTLQPALQNVMGGFATIDPERGWRVSSDYLLAFFGQYLKDEPSTLLDGASADYPEVIFESSET
jgi:pimeloyl-ACP methyl ester carboxylesterase